MSSATLNGTSPDAAEVAPGTQTIVYKYGIPTDRYRQVGLDQPDLPDLPPAVIREIWLAHRLRNELVTLERQLEETVAGIWGNYPEVAESRERAEALQAEVDEISEVVSRARQKARSAKAAPEDTAKLKAKNKELKEARTELRAVKSRSYAMAKPAMEEAGKEHQGRVKALYAVFVAQGMYWATYNDVVAHHKTAMQMVRRARTEGRPAEINYHTFDGSGTCTVQLQRASGEPPRSPSLLAQPRGHKWANVLHVAPWMDPAQFDALPHPEQRTAGLGVLRMRVGSGESMTLASMPVRLHRMLPPEADIAMARITRRRIGTSYRSSVSLTVRIPAPPMRTEGPLAAVHMGWRVLDDGAIRVAVLQGTTTPVPAWLLNPDRYATEVVRSHGHWSEVVVPASWREVHKVPARVRSQRDLNLESLRSWLREFITANPAAEEALCTVAEVAKRRSPRFYGHLSNGVRSDYENRELPDWLRPAYDQLMAWRKQDEHLWNWEANERDQLVRRRDYAWQNVAAWLCAEAAVVVVDEWSVASLARAPKPGEAEDGAAMTARANRVLASPGRLREMVGKAAARRGVRVTAPDARVHGSHHTCGSPLAADTENSLMRWCESCQLMVDQDYNSLQNMLHWARTGSAVPAASVPA